MKPTATLLVLSAVLAAGVTTASAQDRDAPTRTPPPEMQAMRQAHQQQRMADLRTVLRLRPDQEGALRTFLDARGSMGGPGRDGPSRAAEAPLTAPQRLDRMAERQADRAAAVQRRADALKTFYAALSPEQRQVFDALGRLQGHRQGLRGRGGGRHGGGAHHGAHGPWAPKDGGPR